MTDGGGAKSRFLGLVSVGAARSLDQTALRSSVIKRIRQIDVKYITHMQSVLAKMEMYTRNGDLVKKMASVRSKNRSAQNDIYKSTLKCSNDSSRLWWNWQFCKDLKIGVTPFPSIGLGRQTTTTVHIPRGET